MSLSEFHLPVTKGKSESSQSKMANCSSDLPYMHDEFVELLWDNGPVTSNRPRKMKDNPYPKIGHFKATEPKLNHFQYSGLNAQDDDIVPWLNYPIEDEDPLRNDYCSDFLDDYSIQSQNNAIPTIKSNFSYHTVRDSHNVEQGCASDIGSVKESQLFQLPPSTKASKIEVTIASSSKAQTENAGIVILNFSHFSRPAALARDSLQCVESNKKANFATGSNPKASTVIESTTSGVKSALVIQDQSSSVQPNGDMISSPKANNHNNMNTSSALVIQDQSSSVQPNGDMISSPKANNHNNMNTSSALVIQDQLSSVQPNRDMISSPKANNHNNMNTSSRLSEAIVRDESEKGNEAVIASSSACSGSGDWEKWKHLEGEESSYQSEDLEGESDDLKKSSTIQGKSKKRSHAAEVHNQSERRRRDRINERMRALQELIPNCNKTDKASMLDEAIEYLKSLQTQVQIMSMGSWFCMPPMMMPHLGASMPHFTPMGMGMGIGLNYWMGLYDMNGSPRCSFIQVPPIQGPSFPYPSIHGSPRPSGLQVFGFPRPMPYRPPTET